MERGKENYRLAEIMSIRGKSTARFAVFSRFGGNRERGIAANPRNPFLLETFSSCWKLNVNTVLKTSRARLYEFPLPTSKLECINYALSKVSGVGR